jgi:hypothetical protein
MPRIIAIIDSDSKGTTCRMDDNSMAVLPHDGACVPCIGELLELKGGRYVPVPGGLPHLTVEIANSREQVVANILSDFVSKKEHPHVLTQEQVAEILREGGDALGTV